MDLLERQHVAEPGPRDGDPLAEPIPRTGAVRIGWVAGALLLAAVVLVVTHLAEEREISRLLEQAKPRWLLVAAILQLATYACAAAIWQRALRRSGHAVALRPLLPLGLAKLFTDQAVPSAGISGTLLVVRGLERRGVPRSAAVSAMLTGLVAFYLAYLLATVGALAVLGRRGELRPAILVPAAALGLLAVAMPLALFVLRRQAARRPLHGLERWPGARDVAAALRDAPSGILFGPRLLAETTLLELAIFVLDAATLGVTLRAVAQPLAPGPVFASFVIASAVSTLAWVPGGLGTFEGACVALLHLHGASIESALAATLLLRAFTFWLPMIPGFALARRETGGRPPPRARR